MLFTSTELKMCFGEHWPYALPPILVFKVRGQRLKVKMTKI